MLRLLWVNLSTLFVHFRECLVHTGRTRRSAQSSDEVVADLYTYQEQLNLKCGELEVKVKKCNERALFHRQRAEAEPSRNGKQREINRAKLYLQDKHRLQEDQDRTLRFMHLIRQQIDSLTSSQMDNIMLDAMHQYNSTAKRMGLPDKTKEIELLNGELQTRFQEVDELQRLLSESTEPYITGSMRPEDDDDELMLELDALSSQDVLVALESSHDSPMRVIASVEVDDVTPAPITLPPVPSAQRLRQRPVTAFTASNNMEPASFSQRAPPPHETDINTGQEHASSSKPSSPRIDLVILAP